MIDTLTWLEDKPTETLTQYQEELKSCISNLKKQINQKMRKLEKIENVLKSRTVITYYHNAKNPKRRVF